MIIIIKEDKKLDQVIVLIIENKFEINYEVIKDHENI